MARITVTPSVVITLDSSCWLEVFDGGARAPLFQKQVAAVDDMLVPVMTVYEVFKYLRRKLGQDAASRAATYMQRGNMVDIDSALVLDAASNGLPLADSLIYATTQLHGAELWTQDAHFEGLPGVKYFPKK
jgi:toxin FitB